MPAETPGGSFRGVMRRWWVVAACMVALALLALALPVHRYANATASARVHEQTTTVAYSYKGDPQPMTESGSVADLVKADFVDQQVAQHAAASLGNVSGSQLASSLGFTALTGTDAELTSSGPSEQVAQARLGAYVHALVSARRAEQRAVLENAASTLAAQHGAADAVKRLRTAAAGVGQQIYQAGSVTSTPPRVLPRWALLAGGALAGLLLGLILALALARRDTRIHGARDLRAAGVRFAEVDLRGSPSGVDQLRVLAEMAAIGPAGGVVAVATPHRDDATALAMALAGSFAADGTPTTLLSAVRAVRFDHDDWLPIPGTDAALHSVRTAREVLGSSRPGEVTVIDAPPVLDTPEALVAAAVADVVVIAVVPDRARWPEVGAALEQAEDAVPPDRVRICLLRGARNASDATPAPAGSRRRFATRVPT